jgi:hypothetical protein
MVVYAVHLAVSIGVPRTLVKERAPSRREGAEPE